MTERDRGATFVTFVLFLMILFGFVGLGVDGAAAFAKRQYVQNGADAAALALAQEYAPDCIDDPGFALPYAKANVPNETDSTLIDEIECGEESGIPFVRVEASADQPAFFLKAVGASGIRIPAYAEVEWGSPVAGEAFPLAVAACEFEHVLALNGGEFEGTPIEVWVPSTNEGGGGGGGAEGPSYCADDPSGDYPPGGFGWLATDGECKGQYVNLDEPDPWIDGSPGNDAPGDCDWADIIGTTVIIPIFEEASGTSEKDYKIKVFASVKIELIQLQTPTSGGGGQKRYPPLPAWKDFCKDDPEDGKWTKHCFYGIFEKYVSIDDHWELGPPDGDPATLIVRLKS